MASLRTMLWLCVVSAAARGCAAMALKSPAGARPTAATTAGGGSTPSRKCAFDLLARATSKQSSFMNVQVETDAAFAALDPRDRRFARHVVSTCERRLGQIDDLTRTLLRLGVAQLAFSEGVPAYAAIDSTVTLAKEVADERTAKMVNAVLRNVERHGEYDEASLLLNVSPRFADTVARDFGHATLKKFVAASMAPPALDLTFRDAKEAPAMLSSMAAFAAAASGVGEANAAGDIAAGEAAEPSAVLLACGSLRLSAPKGGVSKLPGYDSGGWWVQDAAATVAAKVALAMKPANILDACAAPGGKTMQLAAASTTKSVVALEKNFKRAKRLRENLARTCLDSKIDVVIVDALDYTGADETFDAILVDAPCSCSGTARHHPDVLRSDADVPNFVILQAKLLDQCWRQTKVGGVLVYSTCSIFKAEGEHQADDFLKRHAGAKRKRILPSEVPGFDASAVNKDGDVRIWPWHLDGVQGCDAHFVARFVRTE